MRTVKRFADALDSEDYEAAEKLLSTTCIYHISGSTIEGPEAVIASYQGNGDRAAAELDSIEYESSVSRGTGDSYVITFIDRLRHRGHELVHTSEQHVELNDAGLISRIRHVDLPGEKEAIQEFQRLTGWHPK